MAVQVQAAFTQVSAAYICSGLRQSAGDVIVWSSRDWLYPETEESRRLSRHPARSTWAWMSRSLRSQEVDELSKSSIPESEGRYSVSSLAAQGPLSGRPQAEASKLSSECLRFPKEKKKKLNAELANGRLAMMAIIGMPPVKYGLQPCCDV